MESSSSFSSSSSSFLGSSKRAKAPASNVGQVVAHCLVDGCDADLSLCKDYHRRHKVCEAHSKTPRVTISGREQRFCQQCSRFHSLVEFDEGKRSCRKRLDGHNRRRRKPQPECMSRNVFSNLQQHGGSDHHLLCFSSPQIPPPSSVLTPSWAAAAPSPSPAPAPAENDHMLYSSSTHQLNYMNPQSSSDPNASHCALSLLSPAPQFGLSHHPHNLHYSFVHDSSAPLHISAPMFHQTTASEGGSSTAPQSHQTGLTFTWDRTASLKWEQLKMEVVSEKRGSMKSKLMMSFYRGGGKQAAAVTTVKPSPAALLVVKKTTTFRSDDGYFHGPNGGGGDQLVDNKATSYISQFKQRLRLEESDLMIDDP